MLVFIVICYHTFSHVPLGFFFFFQFMVTAQPQCFIESIFSPYYLFSRLYWKFQPFVSFHFFNVDCSLHNFIFLIKKNVSLQKIQSSLIYNMQNQNHLHSHYIWSWSQQLFWHIYFKNMTNLKVDYMVYELLFCYLTILCETVKHFYDNKICNTLSIVYIF